MAKDNTRKNAESLVKTVAGVAPGSNSDVNLTASDVGAYSTGEVDTALNDKADKSTTYTETEVDDILAAAVSAMQAEKIGQWFKYDALTTELSDLYVRPLGTVLLRADYPEWWEWIQNSRVTSALMTDSEWLAVQVASPNGAVSDYSSGDGSTTFRVPSTGNTADGSGVFFRDKGNITDPVLLNVGHQDQIVNIEGEFYIRGQAIQEASEVFSQITSADGVIGADPTEPSANSQRVLGNGVTAGANRVYLDASKQVNTGDQVQPNNMLMSYYIYTGKGTAV